MFVIMYFSCSLWWYVAEDEWKKGADEYFTCAIGLISKGLIDEIEETCPHLVQPAILSNISFFGTVFIVLGGIILQMTQENIKFWKDKYENCRKPFADKNQEVH